VLDYSSINGVTMNKKATFKSISIKGDLVNEVEQFNENTRASKFLMSNSVR